MSDLVMIENGKVFVSSNKVAEIFEKEHRNVIRNIKSVIKSNTYFGSLNFERTTYTTEQNKVHDCYNMTRDGFALIAMGFSGQKAMDWKIKYINAFNMMESALIGTAPALETVNQIVKRAESDKQIASACGSQLAKYKRVKKKNEDDLSAAMKSVQMALGFK
ncbi:MAG: Rha family transcriptional regulator [Aeromonadaceae bacterium]